jgi:hypothetical protein
VCYLVGVRVLLRSVGVLSGAGGLLPGEEHELLGDKGVLPGEECVYLYTRYYMMTRVSYMVMRVTW